MLPSRHPDCKINILSLLTTMAGKLYIVPTPVGNLEDMTFRAVEVLRQVDLILAEDTRTTSVLLKHYGISRPTEAHHKFNEHARVRTTSSTSTHGYVPSARSCSRART